jgi:hypothetical protein
VIHLAGLKTVFGQRGVKKREGQNMFIENEVKTPGHHHIPGDILSVSTHVPV